uniref:Uncharacterized protein n=1 Tax=Rhizophora mucronata TaxID=61149 RepID=A0A2P2PZ85_RHIMU
MLNFVGERVCML